MEDGLCRKYSLVLTLYTSGNLESFLRRNRDNMSLATDEGRMKLWAFQVRIRTEDTLQYNNILVRYANKGL